MNTKRAKSATVRIEKKLRNIKTAAMHTLVEQNDYIDFQEVDVPLKAQ